ncbi:Gamma-tubulin complex component 2 [Chionoecetes opilio]|uniref:Gamma-tubulin complex component 2 n=1 Tax=Chionoecetes opilio TaxID=41210 RepID=A0A8J5CMT4_CHIOP|nr:Gamma-tubulin complex component 2 [Chionoecetes opilio]
MSEFRIHHQVSELFLLLGIRSDAAERHTEHLRDSAERSDSGQESAASAVHFLAESAPDRQAFLTKYNELKSRNVRDLDHLVVLLSGLVQDPGIRQAVEGRSRQRLEEDGLSLTTVPSVLADLEQATQTTLSRDQLNEVRKKCIGLTTSQSQLSLFLLYLVPYLLCFFLLLILTKRSYFIFLP